MAGTITHSWNGTVLTITSDSGTSSCDLKGATGDIGARGPQGEPGIGIGIKGDTGADGATGAQIVSTELTGQDENGGNIYTQTFDNGVTATFTAPKGDKGEKGETGEKGADGDITEELQSLADAAANSASEAADSATRAESAFSNASGSASEAAASAEAAATSEANAGQYSSAAQISATEAENFADSASSYASSAQTYMTEAQSSKLAAEESATAAAASAEEAKQAAASAGGISTLYNHYIKLTVSDGDGMGITNIYFNFTSSSSTPISSYNALYLKFVGKTIGATGTSSYELTMGPVYSVTFNASSVTVYIWEGNSDGYLYTNSSTYSIGETTVTDTVVEV